LWVGPLVHNTTQLINKHADKPNMNYFKGSPKRSTAVTNV